VPKKTLDGMQIAAVGMGVSPGFTQRKETVMTPRKDNPCGRLLGRSGVLGPEQGLIEQLKRELDALWRCDRYIARSADFPALQEGWRDLRREHQGRIHRIRRLIVAQYTEEPC
jgi:hypothetical protein